jgi:hypothetical protein
VHRRVGEPLDRQRYVRAVATQHQLKLCREAIAGTRHIDTAVAGTVVGAVSDAAGKAVSAGVAGQALPERRCPTAQRPTTSSTVAVPLEG